MFDDVVFKDWCSTENVNPTNIHHVIGTSEGLTWGYGGEGPKDFSLNILLHFSGGDLSFARRFASDFLKEVVMKLPQTDGTLPASLIKAWVDARLDENVLPFGPEWDWAEIKDEYRHRESEFIKSA